MRIGIDTGGTFTDCVFFEGSQVRVLKVFTSPEDPAHSIFQGIERLHASTGRRIRQPIILHGTTVATNSVLERKGARVALVTTAGFEDLIEIGRQNRPQLYNFDVRREPPLVEKRLRWGIPERTAANGEILSMPSASDLARLNREIKKSGAESIALCFLFSYANPRNEQTAARSLRKLKLPISVSHEILPEFREYERLSTVVINAYLAPRLGKYLRRLQTEMARWRPSLAGANTKPQPGSARIFVMQSSGGITTALKAAREPVRTILSGPAGGVVAARWLADLIGVERAISFDMGGTSTDVCLLDGPARTTQETLMGALPVAVPVLDVHSVGAGGGSLARMDAGGALRVGPESAGASPGPACYGRGGDRPTVTDANLMLRRLVPEHFLGGEFRLDFKAAEHAFETFLKNISCRHTPRAFQSALELAGGMVAVSNATIEKAVRVISVERGHDPRMFSLICFGGAGGLHAAELAWALGLAQVVVPLNPGAFSAMGILLSDVVADLSQSVLMPVPPIAAKVPAGLIQEIKNRFVTLETSARDELRRDAFPRGRMSLHHSLHLRYAGQSYELPVTFTARFADDFHREHERRYGYCDPARSLEIVSLHLRTIISSAKPAIRLERATKTASPRSALIAEKRVWFEGQWHNAPFYDRARLRAGMRFMGPAVVVEYSSTTVIPPQFSCSMDEYRNLILRDEGHTRRGKQEIRSK